MRDGVDWQTGAEEFDAADWSTHVGGASEQRRPRAVGFLRNTDRRRRRRFRDRRGGDRGLRHRAARVPVPDVDARRAGQAADRRQPSRAE